MEIKDTIKNTTNKLLAGRSKNLESDDPGAFPENAAIVDIIGKLRKVVFPEYFNDRTESELLEFHVQELLAEILKELSIEIEKAILGNRKGIDATAFANTVSAGLIEQLGHIQELLYKDAKAGFDGDPAARSVDEVIITYPGFFAVFVYRIANYLFTKEVPYIPRIMSEYAHSLTGIDIHPGASIGENFFIDHGTGVVIGETTAIGNNVKLYQGVTLGALSTRKGQALAGVKRHPTIEDNVTIYSGASILGGETIIGRDSTIGGNVFITESVPEGARCSRE